MAYKYTSPAEKGYVLTKLKRKCLNKVLKYPIQPHWRVDVWWNEDVSENQAQGLYVFEENTDDNYTSGNSEMGRRMQSNLQKLVAAGKVNLEALSCFQELKRKDDDAS